MAQIPKHSPHQPAPIPARSHLVRHRAGVSVLYRVYPNIGYARDVTVICRRRGFKRLIAGSVAALILGACTHASTGPSTPAAPSAPASIPTLTAGPTTQLSASTTPSIQPLAAPADSGDLANLVAEMRFRSGIGVTLTEFVTRWNKVASDALNLDPSAIRFSTSGILHTFDAQHALFGFVTDTGELTSIALVDSSNLIADPVTRSSSTLTGDLARLGLVAGTEPGLGAAELGALEAELMKAVRFTAGDVQVYDVNTTYATQTGGVVYYLVGTTNNTLVLIAGGVQ